MGAGSSCPFGDQSNLASLEKLAGMWLKNLYLDGHDVEKDSFRSIALSGECQIAAGDVSAMPAWTRELLKTLPVHQWRAQRQENFAHLCNGLTELSGVTALRPVTVVDGNTWTPKQQGAAFTAVLVCDSPAQREMLRRALIVRRVYPAVLWPLENLAAPGISNAALHLSRCTLSLHCDMRYTLDDMDKLGEIVRECATDMVN